MTTPRIEEMVDAYEHMISGAVLPPSDWLRKALTEAHQAGIDEAVEIVKGMIDHQAEYGGQPFGDIYNSSYKKVIKALQDNK